MSTGTVRHVFAGSWQRCFVLGLLVFFLVLGIVYDAKVVGKKSALMRWYNQLEHLDEGENAWERYNYPNPPIMAVLLQPLIQLPPAAAAFTWFFLKVGMTLLALAWVFRLVEQPDHLFPPWAKVLTVLLSIRPIMGDLIHGNINLFILFLVVAGLYAFHRGRGLVGGVVLALAIACKVTPALFIPYFLWKRAWAALAGCAVGLVLFFGLVPAAFLGWQKNAEDLNSWVKNMVVPYVVKGEVTSEHNNQSLPGLAYRLLTHSPSFSDYDEHNRYRPLAYHNLATLDPAVVRWLLKGCMVLFAGLVVWSCRTPASPRAGWRLAAEFAVIVLGMLLFSERTWKHHCVTLVLPFAVIAYYLAACRPGPRLRAYLIASLAVAALLMLATSTGWGGERAGQAVRPEDFDPLDRVGKMAQVYGAYVGAFLTLLAALVVLLKQPSAKPQAA